MWFHRSSLGWQCRLAQEMRCRDGVGLVLLAFSDKNSGVIRHYGMLHNFPALQMILDLHLREDGCHESSFQVYIMEAF